jgi:hypothetical protein
MYVEELYAQLSLDDAYTLKVEINECVRRSKFRRQSLWVDLQYHWQAKIEYYPPQRDEEASCEVAVYDGQGRLRFCSCIFLPRTTRKFDPCLTPTESIPCPHSSEKTATSSSYSVPVFSKPFLEQN